MTEINLGDTVWYITTPDSATNYISDHIIKAKVVCKETTVKEWLDGNKTEHSDYHIEFVENGEITLDKASNVFGSYEEAARAVLQFNEHRKRQLQRKLNILLKVEEKINENLS